jgi:hypothetical protein
MAVGAADVALGDLQQQFVPVGVADEAGDGGLLAAGIPMIEVKTPWVAFTAVDARVLEQVGQQAFANAASMLGLASRQVCVCDGPVGPIPRGVAVAASRLPAIMRPSTYRKVVQGKYAATRAA